MVTSDVADRIRVLEDREAIKEVIANYCHGVDKRDKNLFLSLWVEDAEWRIGAPFGDFKGRAQIGDVLEQIWQALPTSEHFTTNVVIDVRGDEAEAMSDVFCTATDSAGRAIMIAATYRDHLVRGSDGRWRFQVRGVKIHYWAPITDPWTWEQRHKFA
jgi:uncharacterized protein (TIGR02246 family)